MDCIRVLVWGGGTGGHVPSNQGMGGDICLTKAQKTLFRTPKFIANSTLCLFIYCSLKHHFVGFIRIL